MTETIAFASSLVLLVLMMVVYGVRPTAAVLWMPVLIAVTFVFSVSVAYPAALLSIWARELRRSPSVPRDPVLHRPGARRPRGLQHGGGVAEANPLSGIFESYRAALLYGTSPDPWMLAIPLAYSAVLLAVVAVPAFRRDSVHFGKVAD